MQQIKWSYDAKCKQWYTLETVAYTNDGYTIKRYGNGDKYILIKDHLKCIGTFNKLKHAKLVAQLLRHG